MINFSTTKRPVVRMAWILPICSALLSACVSLAPGADKIRVTGTASDVSGCTALGNIRVPRTPGGTVDIANAPNQFRNQAVGLGANTALVTSGFVSVPAEGVAYRCP
jgi:hypothetical protein